MPLRWRARINGSLSPRGICTVFAHLSMNWLALAQLNQLRKLARGYSELRTASTPSRLGRPRGLRGRRSSHSGHRTILAALDSIGYPRDASPHLYHKIRFGCASEVLNAGFQEVSATGQTKLRLFLYIWRAPFSNGKAGNDSDRQRSDYGIVPPHL